MSGETGDGAALSLWALHGFLGEPADWEFLRPRFPALRAPALLQDATWTARSLPEAAERLVEAVRAAGGPPPDLLGYSLGGRLALHALVLAPEAFRRVIVVSAHPGLPDPAARIARRAADELWAQRFETEDWTRVRAAWNAQGVLSPGDAAESRTAPERSESGHPRGPLAAALRRWSLGTQKDLAPALAQVATPLLWVVGASDAKFVREAERLRELAPALRVARVPGASHRVPWDAPAALSLLMRDFLR